jgi:large subunit ribosomal protein L10
MPSQINTLLAKEVSDLVAKQPSYLVVDPSRLNSKQQLALRQGLHKTGAKMKVAKLAHLRRVVPEALRSQLDGKTTIALVAAPDMVSAAKVVDEYTKDDKLTFKGGVMDGAVIDAKGAKRLASLPDKQTLRGMLVNVLAAPLVGLARVIAEIEKKNKPAA